MKDKKKCRDCKWKLETVDGQPEDSWCYMFEDFMPDCAKYERKSFLNVHG